MLLKEIYAYREMIRSLIKRDLKGRYKNSVLGFVWTFLNPLFQLIIYTIVFSVIIPMGIDDYYIHLFVAIVPWIFVSTCFTGGTRVIIDQQDMVKKIHFPREVLPISFVTSQFVNMLLTFIVIFAVLIITGHGLNPLALLCLPLVFIVNYLLCLGIVFFSSAITVYLRDMEMIFNVIAMGWMYLCPIIYSEDRVAELSEPLQKLYYIINPVTPLIVAYRDILYYKRIPDMLNLLYAFVWSIVILAFGIWFFKRKKRRFAEEL